MRFSVPTNWDDRLIEEIPLDLIGEFYGKLHTDYIGGGRSSYSCPPVSRRTAARHIAKIRSAGKHFNYLLNSACLANEEFTSRWQKQFESLTAWLYDNGVDTFTVSVPYLLELLKIRLPRARVCVSAFAHINSAHKASFWERLGADEITLSPPEMNRNFKALRAVRSAVRCGLKLIVNNNCLLSCPLHIYHSNITAHASRLRENTCGYTIDYCRLNCRYLRLADPSNYLKADWIRPEDLHIYEEAGIDTFKLVDRILSTPAILKISSAYFSGRHDGNLLDLFPRTRDIYVQQKNTLPHYFRYFFRPHLVNPFRLVKIRELMKEIEIYIDNRALDGFLEEIKETDCVNENCDKCGYCSALASSAVKIAEPGRKELTAAYRKFLRCLTEGETFRYPGLFSRRRKPIPEKKRKQDIPTRS